MSDIFDQSGSLEHSVGNKASTSPIKTGVESILAIILLVLLSPLLIMIAIAIKLTSKGPVLYRQRRRGLNGEMFRIFKFRTMAHKTCPQPFRQAVENDTRITTIGRLLRKTSLDELPQLLNIVIGDMSFVGPRPHTPELDDAFKASIPGYMTRYLVKPGVTGLAQVNGHRGPTPDVPTMAARISDDLDYIDNWSPMLDVSILFKTVWRVGNLCNGI